MKYSFIVLILLLSVSAYSQEALETCPATFRPDSGDAVSFKRHVIGRASFCLPIELERLPGKCYEGGCGTFRSKRFLVTVDEDLAAWRPTSDRYRPSYKEEFGTIAERPAWLWHFDRPDKEFRYRYGALMKSKKEKYDFGFYFSSTELGHEDLARIIFQSIRLSDTK